MLVTLLPDDANTKNIKRVMIYLLKDLNGYNVQNSDDYKSYLLHDGAQLNYIFNYFFMFILFIMNSSMASSGNKVTNIII